MPVFLEVITQPDDQDRRDLVKVLADWPSTLPALHAPDQDTGAWLDSLLADARHVLFGGRFNGRLIAAVWLEHASPGRLRLRALCVRGLTRRRGVGERLLVLLGEWLDAQQLALECDLPLPLPARAWIGQYGFRTAEPGGRLLRLPGA